MSEEVSAFSAYQNVLANKKVEVPKKKKKKSKVSLSDLYLKYIKSYKLNVTSFIEYCHTFENSKTYEYFGVKMWHFY